VNDKDVQLKQSEQRRAEHERDLQTATTNLAARDKALAAAQLQQTTDYQQFHAQASNYEKQRAAEREAWKQRERELMTRLEKAGKELNETKWALATAKHEVADAKTKLEDAAKKQEASKLGRLRFEPFFLRPFLNAQLILMPLSLCGCTQTGLSAVQKQQADREAAREREWTALRAQESDARKRIAELETSISALQHTCAEREKEIGEWSKRHAEWLAREESYQSKLNSTVQEASAERDALKRQIEALGMERKTSDRSANAALDTATADLAAAQKKIAALQAAAQTERERHAEREAALEKERDQARERTSKLEKKGDVALAPGSPDILRAASDTAKSAEDEREEQEWIARQKEKKKKRKEEQKRVAEAQAAAERKIASLTEKLEGIWLHGSRFFAQKLNVAAILFCCSESLLEVKRMTIEKANRVTEMDALKEQISVLKASAGSGAPSPMSYDAASAVTIDRLQRELEQAVKAREESQVTAADLKSKIDRTSSLCTTWQRRSRLIC
jgi:hypothetical protein